MTTILKALQELESRSGIPVRQRVGAWTDQNRKPRWVLVVALLVLAGGATGLGAVLFTRGPQPSASKQAPKVVAPQERVVVQRIRPSAPPMALAKDDPPWGRVRADRPPTTVEPRMRHVLTRRASVMRNPRAPEVAPSAQSSPPDEPRVEVQSISYSPKTAERSVTLKLDDGRAVTLHEGESMRGIEVQLILRDAVYLRHGATVFAMGATP